MWLDQEAECGGGHKHTAGRWNVAECVGFLPRCGGCGAALGVSCAQLLAGDVWGGVVGWPNVCVAGWWSATTAGSAL